MDQASAAKTGQVTVTVIIRGRGGLSEQSHEFQVRPRLEDALYSLAPVLEQKLPQDMLQSCLVALNGRNIQALEANTIIQNGDTFTIVPAIAGGC